MGRRSSDSEVETRTRKKKKHRRRSSSSSSSEGRTRTHKKSGRRSRSRSKEAYSSSHSYDKRRRRRSSSESSYSSRRKRSTSRSRARGKSRKVHRSRTSRDVVNIKAGLEHLTPAEKAKATLQMVLQAAAKADEALRAKEKNEEDAKKRKEEDQLLLVDQVKRVKEIEAIESDSFIPQMFRSSRDTKTSAESSETKHEAAILGTGTSDLFGDEKEADIATIPTAIKYLDDNSIAHPNLYIEKAEAEEKWFRRLTSLRQERLMGSPVA
ncbi:serine/Arginine-related protein 53 isoform X2 [Mixophyes fleayi]|uniref:serine/Arginine-related protein 53 isoform X2 n=1 Tax=Mixophyes fleayi TaxID=3061075 RepID=UPI003F4E44AE